ncbi:hypothetical protein PHET_05442 [Paragonimus heterotremus]|uniref:Uncharacterized protein n=1 Tax=Paragonimus heterotremus TaxID=100268 RepID=A0A8J4WIF7_9TREM|nr:hypothetical protein PHET_05442 [Paragonimus heterotremus]
MERQSNSNMCYVERINYQTRPIQLSFSVLTGIANLSTISVIDNRSAAYIERGSISVCTRVNVRVRCTVCRKREGHRPLASLCLHLNVELSKTSFTRILSV